MSTEYTKIFKGMDEELFKGIFGASTRQARETYFNKHEIKEEKSTEKFPKPGAKNEAKAKALLATLQEKTDDEMCEEILRSWLLTKRELLAATLDHWGIEHDNGLTESDDLDKKVEGLDAAGIKEIADVVKDHASPGETVVYLKFLGVKGVDEALA